MLHSDLQKFPKLHHPTILLVDDDPVVLMSLEALLAPLECQIISCSNGKDAISQAESRLPDLILLDIMLPEMDGYQVLEQLRSLPVLDTTPILLMSALDYTDEIHLAFEKGADDLIQKPFPKGVLKTRVRNLIQLNRQRRITEAGLKAERAMNRSLSGFIEVDQTFQILWANPRGCSILGVPNDEAQLKAGYSLIQVFEQKQAITRPHNAFEVHEGWENEGPRYVWLCSADDDGGGWFLFCPISWEYHCGRKTVCFEIRDIEDKIARARERMSFQQAMCHKLNTPLHQAIMAIQCLIAENQASEHRSEEEDSMLQIAVEALGSLHAHVEKILHHTFVSRSFRRVVDGMRVLRMEQIIREVYDVIPMTKQLEVNVMAEASDVRYRISEEAFSMVMRELFDNAVKFHPDQAPSVRVDIRVESGSFLELVFMDDGPGVETSKLTWLARPYTQIEEDPTGNVPGLGLGLATLTLEVWQFDGVVEFRNRTGQSGLVVKLGLKPL
jgi:CheY-like chemotaxis protein/anti-sigma regulatory factor (Ser/Thr protein kinase)